MEGLLIRAEGPETFVLSNILKDNILNKKIVGLEVNPRCRYRHNNFKYELLENNINGFKIKEVFCVGKNYYIKIEKNKSFYIELIPRGTGKFKGFFSKDWCIRFDLDDGTSFYHSDEANYGLFNFRTEEYVLDKFSKILFNPFTGDVVDFKTIKKEIKSYKCVSNIFDNSNIFPGVGIYLRSEIMYDAKIFPYKICSFLKDKEIENILISTQKIYNMACESNGILDQVYNEKIKTTQSFFDKCNVFYKKRDKLNNKVILSLRPEDKKTVFFVKEVQGYDR